MKKIVIFLCLLLINFNVSAKTSEKQEVELQKCVDGDTAYFILNKEEIKTRFLAIDTPESTTQKEAYGKEASDFTCSTLKNAKTIEIEYDENSDKTDKYDRHLVWVFVDGELLQNLIIKEGLAEVAYLYDDYKYTEILKNTETIAKENKINIWSENNIDVASINQDEEKKDNTSYIFIILAVIALIIIFIFGSKKTKQKITNKAKKEIKKVIKKQFNI